MQAHRKAPIPRLGGSHAGVPEELDAIAARMIAKKPAQRFDRPRDVADRLAPFAAGSDLVRLVQRARTADGDTESMARDLTERRPTATWLSVRRRPKSVGVALLLSSAILIALAYTAVRNGSTPVFEMLISSEPSNVLWDYDPTQEVLHAQADGMALFRAGTLGKRPSRVVTTLDNDGSWRWAGLFFGYRHLESGREVGPVHGELVGVWQHTPGEEGAMAELFRCVLTITQSADGSSLWMMDGMVTAPAYLDSLALRYELAVELADGRVQQVFRNGKEIDLLANSGDNDPADRSDMTGTYGVFVDKGAAKFYKTRAIVKNTSN